MTTPAGLLVPGPNDTISEEYWGKVNRAIYEAGLTTRAPTTRNDRPPPPEPEPYKKIFEASQSVDVADTPQAQQSINNWQLGTPAPPEGESSSGASQVRQVGVVPYDMALGAHILYALSPKNTQTPAPTQDYINEAFIAECPLVIFSNAVEVRAPRCSSSLGEWADVSTSRHILRWSPNSQGGLRFSADSAISGNGSVLYAELREKMTFNQNKFELLNCMGLKRYEIEEQIFKVNSAATGATSMTDDQGATGAGTSYFYKYLIVLPNGTTVADSGLIRMDQSEVNFTQTNEGTGIGKVVAVASREGDWTKDGWRMCDGADRGWKLTFPTEPQHFDSSFSVQDLRVASTIAVTLMAFRDESAGYDGFQHVGQGYLYWQLVRTIFWIFFALLLLSAFMLVWTRKQWDKKLWKFLSKVETVLLPKRSAQQRHNLVPF